MRFAGFQQVLNAGTKQKRLERATALLRRLKVRDNKRVFFTDEKFFFYLNPSVSNQNNRVCAWTFLSVPKSLGGNTVMPITLEHYKLITC